LSKDPELDTYNEPAAALEPVGPDEASPPRILLAEDEPAFRELLREALVGEGYHVVEAADGLELREHLQRDPPYDLVVSDVRMPRASGVEVLEWNFVRDPRTRFLLITAFGDAAIHARASEFEVTVLDKPFDLDEFLIQVRALVEHWGPDLGWSLDLDEVEGD